MSTHPYIPWYVDDYDAATAHLSVAEDGVYSRLMRLCWRTPGCSLPNDHAWIARKIRLSQDEWEAFGRGVLEEFFTLHRGRLIQKRLRREYDSISRKKSARVAAGKKGGTAKAQKSQEKSASNASVLSPDTRAFPEPEPEPDKRIEEGAQVLILVPKVGEDASPKRGARLPADWIPTSADIAYAIREHHFSQGEVDRIGEQFRDYWVAVAGQKGVKLDWSATWRNWVRTERERRPVHAQRKRVDWV